MGTCSFDACMFFRGKITRLPTCNDAFKHTQEVMEVRVIIFSGKKPLRTACVLIHIARLRVDGLSLSDMQSVSERRVQRNLVTLKRWGKSKKYQSQVCSTGFRVAQCNNHGPARSSDSSPRRKLRRGNPSW